MSVWRDVPEAGANALHKWLGRERGPVRVMGVDETMVKVGGQQTAMGLVTDATAGELLGLDALVVRDSAGFLDGLGLGKLLAA